MSTNESAQAPMRRYGGIIRSVLFLVLASFLVGVVLDVAGVDPISFWRGFVRWIGNSVEAFLSLGWGTISMALTYVAIGAVIVLPIWAVLKLIDLAKK